MVCLREYGSIDFRLLSNVFIIESGNAVNKVWNLLGASSLNFILAIGSWTHLNRIKLCILNSCESRPPVKVDHLHKLTTSFTLIVIVLPRYVWGYFFALDGDCRSDAKRENTGIPTVVGTTLFAIRSNKTHISMCL